MQSLKWKTIKKDEEWRMIITSKYYLKILQEYIPGQPPLPIFKAYLCIRGLKARKYYLENTDITIDKYLGRYLSIESAKKKAPVTAFIAFIDIKHGAETAEFVIHEYIAE